MRSAHACMNGRRSSSRSNSVARSVPHCGTERATAVTTSTAPCADSAHLPLPAVIGAESARHHSQRAPEAPRRDEVDASHHGDMPQNAALTCASAAQKRRGTARRGQIANVEYPHFKCGASILGASGSSKAAGQRHRALTRK